MVKTDWKADRQRRTNQRFCDIITQDFDSWARKNDKDQSPTSIIEFLVRHNVIRESIVNRYVIIKDYPNSLQIEGGKEKAVFSLSNLVPLEPVSIYYILANHATYFKPNRMRW